MKTQTKLLLTTAMLMHFALCTLAQALDAWPSDFEWISPAVLNQDSNIRYDWRLNLEADHIEMWDIEANLYLSSDDQFSAAQDHLIDETGGPLFFRPPFSILSPPEGSPLTHTLPPTGTYYIILHVQMGSNAPADTNPTNNTVMAPQAVFVANDPLRYSGGSGTSVDPFQIATAQDLIALGETPVDYDKHFVMTADIDLSGYTFDRAVIAYHTGSDTAFDGTPFTGSFDGQGQVIRQLRIDGADYVGLFGQLDTGAKVTNLGLETVDINGTADYVGSLAGFNFFGSVSNNYSTGMVTGHRHVGGLVGRNLGGSISSSYSTSTTTGNDNVGGLVGGNSGGSVYNSYSTGEVAGSNNIGGLVGENVIRGSVSNSYSTDMIKGDEAVGGLVGFNYHGILAECYNTGEVTGVDDVGGLVGRTDYGSVANSFSTGVVTGNTDVGGLVGDHFGNVSMGKVSNSYSTGVVTGTRSVGGLVGNDNYGYGIVSNSFWDTETSGQSSSAGGMGLTTAEMQDINNYLDAGWHFNDIWKIWDGYDYPRLQWELGPDSPLVFVEINDPGVLGHEGFTGQMSKYETTNDQYAAYLNAALADGLIQVVKSVVYAVSDSSKVEPFCKMYSVDGDSQIEYNQGRFIMRTRDGYNMANHPVVDVSWHGATAFCDYYGYRLPTEWEWEAVADYDGSYVYGCGTSIGSSKANYCKNNPLGLSDYPYTSPVGYYPAYGYGLCGMAGNVWEWTSSIYYSETNINYSGINRIFHGGGWDQDDAFLCNVLSTVSVVGHSSPDFSSGDLGFRACR